MRSLTLMCSAALCGAVSSVQVAVADEVALLKGFTTPSGNIGCYVEDAVLVCEIAETKWQPEVELTDCDDLDSGKQISMPLKGEVDKGSWWCRGDTWLHEGIKPLAYGASWKEGGFVCESLKTGLKCLNVDGHGWVMSKKTVQRI